MSDKFEPIPLKQLLQIILNELHHKKSIFGIPRELFFVPKHDNPFRIQQFDQELDTPIGVAAGPHSQMAQNIIGAWLMGASYIELKTIQTLDELELAKPCIDMQDEGYNCEWSQELKIKESFNEYLNAWIIIHILHHELGFKKGIGTIFNMSVGYNLEGIMKENVQWFFEKMNHCQTELEEKIKEIKDIFPEIKTIAISSKISNNITLSTMHGCPANEIESIARYLLEKKKLHTYVKLNPTLLGPEMLRDILNNTLHFKTIVPDIAFEHDLKYPDALTMIQSLQKTAKDQKLHFGLKLTNTLESLNNKSVFDSSVEMMYMSGRALHPISINLANKLQKDLKGEIPFSFSAGIDAFNICDILSSGFKTVTVCSDILKPGGYMRLHQYIEEAQKQFSENNSKNIEEFIIHTASNKNTKEASIKNLSIYAEKVLTSKSYKREYIVSPDIKTTRQLGIFDCISAPCKDTCSTNQDIPNYMFHTSHNNFEKAYEVILRTNPFPSITGMVCDHLCQNKCTRVNYDHSLLIREVKRFISEQNEVKLQPVKKNKLKIAVIGAGPSGLSCAYYLALAGFSVEVFEAKSKVGGMVQFAIPGFRLTDNAIDRDFKRVTDLGVTIHYNHKITKERFLSLQKKYDYIYLGPGAQLSANLDIDGTDSKGVLEPLEFLFKVKKGEESGIGNNVVIIGGGNTAMDAARTAYRLVGKNGKVTIVYRRTMNEMPADQGEIKAVMEEGMEIMELIAPEKVISKNEKVVGLLCCKMHLSGTDHSGRPKPLKIPGSEFEISCDTIIPAVGQNTDIDFIAKELLTSDKTTYQIRINNVFIGGDALRGASTAINAIGDGRKAAEQIMKKSEIDFSISYSENNKHISKRELLLKRAKRIHAAELIETPINNRKNFTLVSKTLDKKTIVDEASRCLYCDEICNICTTVCPNFANYSYDIKPVKYQLQKAITNVNGKIDIVKDEIFEVKQPYQIINIANFCNECGNCNSFCPTSSAPYKEKPKLYLTASSFKKTEEGYFFNKRELLYKHKNITSSLKEIEKEYIFESKNAIAHINKEDFKIIDIQIKNNKQKEFSFELAATMSVIFRGAESLMVE